MVGSLWPASARAAVSITLDNLGEAQQVNSGKWLSSQPIGAHVSVSESVPRILEILSKYGVQTTYFMEAWSMDVYPSTVAKVIQAGHEIGYHAYQHETWSRLTPAEEQENLEKSLRIARNHGITYKGFRPPGGLINTGTKEFLQRHGFKYVSVLGDSVTTTTCSDDDGDNGFVVLPFHWKAVDALYLYDGFDHLRAKYGVKESVFSPQELQEALFNEIDAAVQAGGFLDILFHPFLHTSNAHWSVIEEVVKRVKSSPEIWCASPNEVAQWAAKNPGQFR